MSISKPSPRRRGAGASSDARRDPGGVARAARDRRARRSARQGAIRSGPEKSQQRLASPVRCRMQMGELFKVIAIHSPRLAGAGGIRHDRPLPRWRRRATRSAWSPCFATASATLSAISTDPRISALFLDRLTPRHWRDAARRSRLCGPAGRGRRRAGRLHQARAARSFRSSRAARRSSCASSMCSGHGRARASPRELMDWAMAEAAPPRRRRALSVRVHRQPPRKALLRPLRLRGSRAATSSWSATRPTRTSSCGCAL